MDRPMNRYLGFTFALLLLGGLSVTRAAERPLYRSLRIIEMPGAELTIIRAANDRGMILGMYSRNGGSPLTGFVQIGRFITDLKVPEGAELDLSAMNDRGEIAGSFLFGEGAFLFSQGRFAVINIPNSNGSIARGINNHGKVVGHYLSEFFEQRGFLFDGDAVVSIEVPAPVGYRTDAIGINDKDQIVGNFVDYIRGASHAFLLVEGVYQTIDMPNSESTLAIGINNRGQILGSYRMSSVDVDHVFLLHRSQFTPIEIAIPNGDSVRVRGFNNQGQIMGSYFDLVAQKVRGFTVDVRELTD